MQLILPPSDKTMLSFAKFIHSKPVDGKAYNSHLFSFCNISVICCNLLDSLKEAAAVKCVTFALRAVGYGEAAALVVRARLHSHTVPSPGLQV